MPTMAGIAGVTIVKSRAERSTDRQSDIMVQAILVVFGQGDSVAWSSDGARVGAESSLSMVVLGISAVRWDTIVCDMLWT